MKLYDELVYRGLIDNISSDDLIDKLNDDSLTFYIGTDPTADSLHIGHLCWLLLVKRLKDRGHTPIVLIGGGTGLIGDPRPSSERPIISFEETLVNIEGINAQINSIVECKIVNNYDWIKNINMIDYLRDYGKYFSVNYMLSKDIVKSRLQSGISYTEFSYMILQSLDFLHLNEKYGCTLQIGGSDQWGNLTSGLELYRKKTSNNTPIYCLSMPLMVNENGVKIGKSEGKPIWLSKEKTSSYELYQYLYNTDDTKVIEFIKKFTFMTKEEIDELEKENNIDPHKRIAAKRLCKEVITLLHGEKEYLSASRIADALFTLDLESLNEEEFAQVISSFEVVEVEKTDTIIDTLIKSNLATSKREAREFLNAGAISVNGQKTIDENELLESIAPIHNDYFVIKRGKKKHALIKLSK